MSMRVSLLVYHGMQHTREGGGYPLPMTLYGSLHSLSDGRLFGQLGMVRFPIVRPFDCGSIAQAWQLRHGRPISADLSVLNVLFGLFESFYVHHYVQEGSCVVHCYIGYYERNSITNSYARYRCRDIQDVSRWAASSEYIFLGCITRADLCL